MANVLLLTFAAWAGGASFSPPAGSARAEWEGPAAQAGLTLVEAGSAATIELRAGAAWTISVHTPDGRVRTVDVATPQGPSGREDVALLASSLLRRVGGVDEWTSPPAVANPMERPDPPRESPPRPASPPRARPPARPLAPPSPSPPQAPSPPPVPPPAPSSLAPPEAPSPSPLAPQAPPTPSAPPPSLAPQAPPSPSAPPPSLAPRAPPSSASPPAPSAPPPETASATPEAPPDDLPPVTPAVEPVVIAPPDPAPLRAWLEAGGGAAFAPGLPAAGTVWGAGGIRGDTLVGGVGVAYASARDLPDLDVPADVTVADVLLTAGAVRDGVVVLTGRGEAGISLHHFAAGDIGQSFWVPTAGLRLSAGLPVGTWVIGPEARVGADLGRVIVRVGGVERLEVPAVRADVGLAIFARP